MTVKPDFSKNANQAATAPAFLSVWDVHAYYGESYIVQGISFNVHEGEILALLGRNGAGKTSTLRVLAGLMRASGGSAEAFGAPCWESRRSLHQRLGYLAQRADCEGEEVGLLRLAQHALRVADFQPDNIGHRPDEMEAIAIVEIVSLARRIAPDRREPGSSCLYHYLPE